LGKLRNARSFGIAIMLSWNLHVIHVMVSNCSR
jgi:hypothetical protein